ncbi:peptidase m75, imelysin [Reichenbachiella sp. 5M10]|uniref:imelysin family protein n=1 Tax=Reichenbachiella sp. 5M10 TaxID=1889772 RepID=UPI000C15B760|nr:imelysin family protein [Reichenbachiella sp. 5M10]PIB36640.1 peptidase m75, imelysin [Reichenbachiella sp. 5M10]
MKRFFTLILTSLVALSACDNDDDSNNNDAQLALAIENYAAIVEANYLDAYDDARALQTAVGTFITAPSEATMEAAKDAWLAARETYGQTEAFRFYGGPIDDEDGPEGQLNAWPLDESHIDYVTVDSNGDGQVGGEGKNIINSPDEFPTITKEVIAEQNENGGETNVSSGYHAIEFLLWGQDVSADAGGGERPYTDYTTLENADRRKTYLSEVTALVVDDLKSLVDEWAADGAFRVSFTASDNNTAAFGDILSALGKLSKGELAGERMYVALDLKSKEDEHSCFSDNTHRDIVTNALGIQNVYEGRYKTTSGSIVTGVSIKSIIAEKDSKLADDISTKMEEALAACEAIHSPFDQEILSVEGGDRVLTAINLLRDQGDLLAEAADAFDLSFDPDDI